MTLRRLYDGRIPRPALNPQDEERIYAMIGRTATEFAALEMTLEEYITDLVKITNPRPERSDVTKIISFKEKVALLEKLVSRHLHSNSPSNELTYLCKLLRTAGCRRNDIIHSKILPIAGERDKINQRWTPGRARNKIVKGKLKSVTTGIFTMTVADMEKARLIIHDAELALHAQMDNPAVWKPD